MLQKAVIYFLRNSNKSGLFTPKRSFVSRDHLNFIKEVKKSQLERPEGLRRKTESEKIGVGGYLLLAIPLTTFGLGVWQIRRKQWKENLIKSLAENLSRPVVPLPDDLTQLDVMEYHTVSVSGYFLHDREILLGPRSLITPGGHEQGGGLMSVQQENMGYLVITPLKLENRDDIILINRGWVPISRKEASSRPEGQVQGLVHLNGVVRHQENRPQFTPENRNKIYFYRNVLKMAQQAGASPIFLDATVDSTVPGGPIGGQTRVGLRNEHLSYIFTWFSLSAFTSWLWYSKIYRRAVK